MTICSKIIPLPNEARTGEVGRAFAATLARNDVIGLIGPLGAGKSTFARSVIAALPAENGHIDDTLAMPSPTFTIVEVYEKAVGQVAHFDLYRLEGLDEQISTQDMIDIGLEEAMLHGPVLIEWADRAVDHLPDSAVLIAITPELEHRTLTIMANNAWFERPQSALFTAYIAKSTTT